ncbi:MAG: PD40 domain-containing protein [Phycisphaerales bacterium]|nr:PD40 domain-containing protein [Phycisphaerales bacterium]
MRIITSLVLFGCLAATAHGQGTKGYYRQPTIHGETIVFVAEGDLWKVSARGGVATRLTTHAGDESTPRLSPDGATIAFTAQYEGPTEVYTMPVTGGVPTRWTYDSSRVAVVGWQGHRVIASTMRYSTLPNAQLDLIDTKTGARRLVELAQAAEGVFDDEGTALYFARLAFQGSHTKRYKGGTAQQLWTLPLDAQGNASGPSTPLTQDYAGTSATPMWWKGRLYFVSDRDGTMEIWSMRPDGTGLTQHTRHEGEHELLDVRAPSLGDGRIVYQLGADLWVYDIARATQTRLEITLDSDFDQMREKWVEKPASYITAAHIAPDGSRVVLTARGQVFVAPRGQGRLVEASRRDGVRYRDARFMPDGESLLTLSDESGEVEFWTLPPNGVGTPTQLTTGADVLRWEGVPSPDGNLIAHHDKDLRLFIYDLRTREHTPIGEGVFDYPGFRDLAWSSDSRWLAYATDAANMNSIVRLYDTKDKVTTDVTTDRYVSYAPAWSADGKWLYLLSDRAISTKVASPWGAMAPEPYFDKVTRIYQIPLKTGTRSPFAPDDELQPKKDDKKKDDEKRKEPPKEAAVGAAPSTPVEPATPPAETTPVQDKPADPKAPEDKAASDKPKDDKAKGPDPVEIDLMGLSARIQEVPAGNGNYNALAATEKRLLFLSRTEGKTDLMMLEITNKEPSPKVLASEISGYELSADRKAILLRKRDAFYVIDAAASAPASLDKAQVDLSGWMFPIRPREEWRQMFVESWRLMRDYFYDKGMHGVDWPAMRERYLPLVDRVSSRAELSDLISQMVGEISALHHFVSGGDLRSGDENIRVASLGALLVKDEAAGGARVERIYANDPDEPGRASPLRKPGVDVHEGDVILEINGISPLRVADPAVLLRNQANRQVLLKVRPKGEAIEDGATRLVIVTPITSEAEGDLRYHEWQHTRRMRVEEMGQGEIGYVHLRAMGGDNFNEFARGFYPVFNRKGLIIDVRHNRGGNIDSWILSRLLRRSWFFWQGRAGQPYWNMQYAFRGHVVVLCNERTASDGEAFAEGIKRLGIGKVIGTRTWGGEIWLSSSNFLVDGGIATAAEYGVYGPEGVWLIEGHGVDPDIVVDNEPHATFKGEDTQLNAAVEYLRQRIAAEPVEVPPPPKGPDLSVPANRRK